MGAVITLGGAVITIALNILLIPRLHYWGAALATFSCYLFMMITSYVLGQKYYPVPYAKKKLLSYIILAALIFLAHRGIVSLWNNAWFNLATATLLFLAFGAFVVNIERRELQKLPWVGKFLKPKVA